MPWDEHDSQLWEGFSGRIEEKPSVVNESAQREFNRLHAEISRLRALVEQAYQEGWQRGLR